MSKKKVLIKIGGRAAENIESLNSLAQEMKELSGNYDFFFVHGGGAMVSEVQRDYGIEPFFDNGRRVTSAQEMDIVDMVLAGKMNKKLVRLFTNNGLRPVGLSGNDGSIFTGKRYENRDGIENRTALVINEDPTLLNLLSKNGYLPVICSVSQDSENVAVNINADDAALAVAGSLKCEILIFISDIPGILKNEKIIDIVDEKIAEKEISNGVISGGMIPKVETSLSAIKNGVGTVIISDYRRSRDLKLMLDSKKGTKIVG